MYVIWTLRTRRKRIYQVLETFDVLPISHKQRENVIGESIISGLSEFHRIIVMDLFHSRIYTTYFLNYIIYIDVQYFLNRTII